MFCIIYRLNICDNLVSLQRNLRKPSTRLNARHNLRSHLTVHWRLKLISFKSTEYNLNQKFLIRESKIDDTHYSPDFKHFYLNKRCWCETLILCDCLGIHSFDGNYSRESSSLKFIARCLYSPLFVGLQLSHKLSSCATNFRSDKLSLLLIPFHILLWLIPLHKMCVYIHYFILTTKSLV